MNEKLTGRERVTLALGHQEADRVPRAESFWPETIPLWHQQGLGPNDDVADLFGYDIMGAGWVSHEARPGFLQTIEETDDWWSRLDGNGAILRYWKHKSGTPEHVDFTVKTRDQWEEHKRQMLAQPPGSRVDTFSALRRMYEAQAKGRWFCWTGVECYETAKDVFGHVGLSYIMADDPEWAKDIFDTEAELACRVLDYLEASGVRFDGGWVYGDIAFAEYFRAATPIDVIERMKIGSRPSLRKGAAFRIEQLRAIPWVFSWSQSRHALPGWFGLGTGLEEICASEGEAAIVDMARDWPFFRLLLEDVEMVLAKGDVGIAALYSQLAGPLHERYWPIIEAEWQRTVHYILRLKGSSELLEYDRRLQRTIRLRNPYVDPISVLQLDLLQRWRAGERKDEDLFEGLVSTVNGIARGLQNTG